MPDSVVQTDPLPRSRLTAALAAGVILIPCVTFAVLGDAPAYAIGAAPVLLAAVLMRRGITVTTRALVYSLTIAAFTAIAANEVYPIDDQRFFFPLIEVLYPFVVALAVCAVFLAQTRTTLAACLALAVCAMMVQGSCVNEYVNTRLPVTMPVLTNRFLVFGIGVGAQMLLLLPLLHRAQRYQGASAELGRRWRLQAVAVALVAVGTVVGARGMVFLESAMEPVYRALLNVYFDHRKTHVVWDGEVDLYRKTSDTVRKQQDAVILRARAPQAPGYLRGRAYRAYGNGTWRGAPAETSLPVLAVDGDLASSRFVMPGRSAPADGAQAIEILPAAEFFSDVLLARGDAVMVELIADDVGASADGELHPGGWERGGAYSVRVVGDDTAFGHAEPSPDLAPYRRVPARLTPLLAQANAELGGAEAASAAARIAAVSEGLQKRCSYELGGGGAPAGADPITHFLFDSRRGHCELFASAAVLLLRNRGVPARYVTGFICAERHPNGDYWVARVGDCHAWVEAYDADAARWVLVEPTPPSGLPAGDPRFGMLRTVWELPFTAGQAMYAQIKRGYFAQAVLGLLADSGRALAWLLWSGPWYIGWPLALAAVALAIRWHRRRLAARPQQAARLRQLRPLLVTLDRALAAHGLQRAATTTLGDLAAAAAATAGAERLCPAIRAYERLRYMPGPASAEAVAAVHAQLRAAAGR
jgi:hypothetical protein